MRGAGRPAWRAAVVAAAVLAVACGERPPATHVAGASDADLILRDVGPLRYSGSARTEPIVARRRKRHRDDRHVAAAYEDGERLIFADATVESFADPSGLLHELERSYRGLDGAFTDGMHVVQTGVRRHFQITISGTEPRPVGLPAPNSRLIAFWPAVGNRCVRVEYVAEGPGRIAEMPAALVDAYLARHPSVLPATVDGSPEHHRAWVREEMPRLLAYAERDLGYVDDVEDHARSTRAWHGKRHLVEFVSLRERCFGVGSVTQFEQDLRMSQGRLLFLPFPDEVSWEVEWLEDRLGELRQWWDEHGDDPPRCPRLRSS